MARQCTGCRFASDDPFADRCPRCGGYLAIVCRAAGNARLTDDPRRANPFAAGRPASAGRSWLVGVAVGLGVAVVALLMVRAPAGRADLGRRVAIGMPVRDAVLALEPDPPAGRQVSLHDLLGPDAPRSGSFAWQDSGRSLRVKFRHGKVTGVHETRLPPGLGDYTGGQTEITADEGGADEPDLDRRSRDR